MGLVSKILGNDEPQPKGYYESQRNQWHVPREVERILPDREGCERVTKLTGRSVLGWVASGVGVITAASLVFSLIALYKQNEKFHRDVVAPVKSYLSRHS